MNEVMEFDMKLERRARNWSRAELSRQAGLNASTVGQIESGRVRPYQSQIDKIREAFLACPVREDENGEFTKV